MSRCHILLLIGLALVFAGCSSVHEDLSRQLLRPPDGWLAEPDDFGLRAEPFEVALHSEASLTGWWLPNPAARGRTVVLLHEEGTNTSVAHPYYRFLHDAGFQVLCFDPRGYGKSQGVPTLRAWLHDVNAVFDWLEQRDDVDQDQIALFGTSMGSVAAMWAARMHTDCRAIVFEHLPSLRDMLREAMDYEDSAASAYQLGAMEFTLPENIEPSDNAPHVSATALFLATEHESERDRRSLLRAFEAYAGDKTLWVLPEAGRAPHAMLVHDGEYQRAIIDFLDRALARRPQPLTAGVRKVRDASDGEAWYEIDVGLSREHDRAPWAIEACVLLADGSPRYARTWIDDEGEDLRLKLPSAPTHVTARRVFDAVADDDGGFTPRRSHLTRSGAAIAPLWPRIEELRNEVLSRVDAMALAGDLDAVRTAEPLHPTVEAELADIYARIGLLLFDDEATSAVARTWLQRAVDVAPEHAKRHFWPGPVPTYGAPWRDAVDAARKLIQ